MRLLNTKTEIDVQFIKKNDLEVLTPVTDFINTDYTVMRYKMYSLIDKLVQKHKTTLIFTNTRSATERVVDTLKNLFPEHYNDENIGAHHSSLSKDIRFNVEDSLRKGKMKCVVSSTSLELGIDIGSIDLVILLGSPKSVARALQRCGRSGHKLDAITKGRIIVLNRDDLVECSVLLKDGIDKKIDKIHIPKNALDVLAQQILSFVFNERMNKRKLFYILKQSYSYNTLSWEDYISVIAYLQGEYSELEDRNVYAKIRVDEESGIIYPKGFMTRIIYMTNVGTIPDESKIKVKMRGSNATIGFLDESFFERLEKGDIFVLAGKTYVFRYARGMTCFVNDSMGRPPTVPSWVSEMLPLSFDLAMDINHFRYLIKSRFDRKEDKKEITNFIKSYLYVRDNVSEAIYNYFKIQYDYTGTLPTDKELVIERFHDRNKYYMIFHSMFGRRVNDVLSRVFAYYLSVFNKRSFEIGINDHSFYIASGSSFGFGTPLKFITPQNLRAIAEKTIDKTQVLKRRFRHCATRSFMILRQYKAHKKSVRRQQMSSEALMRTIRGFDDNFPLMKEARREVLEDLMDIDNSKKVIEMLSSGKMSINIIDTAVPSPFSFNILLQGISDILKNEDKTTFLKRLHEMVLAEIMLKQKKQSDFKIGDIDNEQFVFNDLTNKKPKEEDTEKQRLKILFLEAANRVNLNDNIKRIVFELIDGEKRKTYPLYFMNWLKEVVTWDNPVWHPKLIMFFKRTLRKIYKGEYER
ncbi:MAG: ATP-dependent helicase [Nitrospiraceae bacterium]|nr:ATP-dependent helicase [Nitrospiraceae bacterium]